MHGSTKSPGNDAKTHNSVNTCSQVLRNCSSRMSDLRCPRRELLANRLVLADAPAVLLGAKKTVHDDDRYMANSKLSTSRLIQMIGET